jgi:PAT family beta-lactamase induction signal transducer AmpG
VCAPARSFDRNLEYLCRALAARQRRAALDGQRRLKGWRAALGVYRQPRVLSMLCLGFSAGLPFYLVFQTLSAWLRQSGVHLSTIGMLSWVGIV